MNNHRVGSIKNIRTLKALRGDELRIDLGREIDGVLTCWMKKTPNSETYRSFEFVDQRYLVLSQDKTKDYYDENDGSLVEKIEGKWYFDVEYKESEESESSKTIYTGTIVFFNDITGSVGYEVTNPAGAPYSPIGHTHNISDINGLQEALDTLSDEISNIEQTPPIHKAYSDVGKLLSDQANQKIGYLYGITNATGFGNITQGRATVSYKGTTNGDERDYNIEWRDDLSNVKTVNTYQDIPLEEGVYFIESASLAYTNATNFENGDIYQLSLSSYYVQRIKVGVDTFINKYYKSDRLVGISKTNLLYEDDEVFLIQSLLHLFDDFLPFNHYQPSDNGYYKGKIEIKNLDENDFLQEGIIKTPYNIPITILNSNLIIDEKSISHEFVYISDSVNETVTPYIRLLDGFKENNSFFLNKKLNLNIDFEINSIDDSKSYESITKEFTTDGSGLIINDFDLSHSNNIKTWIQEYINNNLTGTLPTIIGYENPDVSTKVGENEYRVDTMYRNNSDLVCSALNSSYGFMKFNDQNKDIFKIIGLGTNSLIRLDRTTAEDDFLADVVMVTSRAETDNDGTDPLGSSYGFGVEFNEPTRHADLTAISLTPDIDTHQQTPATAIVTAKFKWLRNTTGAPWGLIREACRATASNANNYNIYRGFGQIDTAAAKTYIESNIDTWTGVNTTELAEYYDAISPYNTAVKLEEKTDKTPVVKKDLKGLQTLVFGYNNQWSLVNNGNFTLPNDNKGYNESICILDSGTTDSSLLLNNGKNNPSFCRLFEDGYKLHKIQLSGRIPYVSSFKILVLSAERSHAASLTTQFSNIQTLHEETFTGLASSASYNFDITVDSSPLDACEIFVFYQYISGGSSFLLGTRTDLIFQK